MKVLVTGAGGFIGSHLVELLTNLNYNVVAFDRYNPNSDRGWLNGFNANDYEYIFGDIRDYDSVQKAVQGCDAVMHLAALIGIPYSYKSPLAYIRTNIEGTYNVLEASKQHSLNHVLITSTSETYGSAQYVPMDEDHPLVGQSPYSASKIGADQLGLSYHKSFGLPVTIVRPFNTYGPRQSMRAVIPTIINQCLNEEPTIKLGSLTPTRDLTYVSDTCEGFSKLLECENAVGEVVNIGTGKDVSIHSLAKLIMEKMGVSKTIEPEEKRIRPDQSEVDRLLCNHEKLKLLTNWTPQLSINEGIERTIDWFKGNPTGSSQIYHV